MNFEATTNGNDEFTLCEAVNPCKSPESKEVGYQSSSIGRYWNAALSVVALTLHCIPFAAFDFLSDDGATGSVLFFLAPIGLILMIGCFFAAIVQAVAMLVAFTGRFPSRYHRMYALLVTWNLPVQTAVIASRFQRYPTMCRCHGQTNESWGKRMSSRGLLFFAVKTLHF